MKPVLTRPQLGLADGEQRIAAAKAEPLPAGPTAWPVVESDELAGDEQPAGQGDETTTSGEAG